MCARGRDEYRKRVSKKQIIFLKVLLFCLCPQIRIIVLEKRYLARRAKDDKSYRKRSTAHISHGYACFNNAAASERAGTMCKLDVSLHTCEVTSLTSCIVYLENRSGIKYSPYIRNSYPALRITQSLGEICIFKDWSWGHPYIIRVRCLGSEREKRLMYSLLNTCTYFDFKRKSRPSSESVISNKTARYADETHFGCWVWR